MRSKTLTILIILITSLIMTSFFVFDIISSKNKYIYCTEGVGTINHFYTSDPYMIAGDWEVYKDVLVISEGLDVSSLEKTYVSSLSSNIKLTKETYYYTYRTVIKGIPKESIITNASNTFLNGYIVYFNGVAVRGDGKLQNKNGEIIPYDNSISSYCLDDSDELEIIVELSNSSSSYYAFINEFYLDGMSGHFELFSYQAVYLIEIIICTLFTLYFALMAFAKKAVFRYISFALLNILAAASVLFNSHVTFFSFAPASALLERFLRVFCYYMTTVIFALLARTNFCTRKIGVPEYILIGTLLLVIIVSIIIPVQFTDYLFAFVFVIAIGILIFSLVSYSKRSHKEPIIQICIIYYIIQTILCYAYEIVLLFFASRIHTHSSLSLILFLACVMLTVLNSSLREKAAANSDMSKELSEKIRETEFTFLNSQIQSHFIYNTLNSIQALCNTNPEKAAALVEDFSFYLRNRLEFNKMPNLINLEDEIEHIKTYINIEQTRFGDNIKCIYDLAVTDIKIPPLSVQPLVENAVKHGVSKQVGGGTIIISTYEDKKNVYIRVKDNGLGFDVEKLKNSKRVGFNNIKDRLELYLGAKIQLDSKPGVGTVVTITIPKTNLTYDKTTSPKVTGASR